MCWCGAGLLVEFTQLSQRIWSNSRGPSVPLIAMQFGKLMWKESIVFFLHGFWSKANYWQQTNWWFAAGRATRFVRFVTRYLSRRYISASTVCLRKNFGCWSVPGQMAWWPFRRQGCHLSSGGTLQSKRYRRNTNEDSRTRLCADRDGFQIQQRHLIPFFIKEEIKLRGLACGEMVVPPGGF